MAMATRPHVTPQPTILQHCPPSLQIQPTRQPIMSATTTSMPKLAPTTVPSSKQPPAVAGQKRAHDTRNAAATATGGGARVYVQIPSTFKWDALKIDDVKLNQKKKFRGARITVMAPWKPPVAVTPSIQLSGMRVTFDPKIWDDGGCTLTCYLDDDKHADILKWADDGEAFFKAYGLKNRSSMFPNNKFMQESSSILGLYKGLIQRGDWKEKTKDADGNEVPVESKGRWANKITFNIPTSPDGKGGRNIDIDIQCGQTRKPLTLFDIVKGSKINVMFQLRQIWMGDNKWSTALTATHVIKDVQTRFRDNHMLSPANLARLTNGEDVWDNQGNLIHDDAPAQWAGGGEFSGEDDGEQPEPPHESLDDGGDEPAAAAASSSGKVAKVEKEQKLSAFMASFGNGGGVE